MNLQELLLKVASIVVFLSVSIIALSIFKHFVAVRQALKPLYRLLNLALSLLATAVGIATGIGVSAYKPVVELSDPQPIKVVYSNANAIPSNAIPSNAIPSNAIPSNAIPSNAIPSNAIPSNAIPSNAIPSNAIPSNAIPAEIRAGVKLQRLPDFGEKVCKTGGCDENTKYTYRSNDPGFETAGSSESNDVGVEPASPSQANSGSISVQFYADRYALTQGECTNIHWDATGANEVWINETPFDVSGVKQVCPDVSKKYQIKAAGEDGSQISSTLDIQVQDAVTELAPGVEVAAPDRCELFDDIDMSVRFLDWQPGASLGLYVKMPGGVPGLEKKIAGDSGDWKYSVEIGSYSSKNCDIIQGYEGRLYCNISVPSDYSNTLRPFSLQVNGCDSPIYSMPLTSMPMFEETAGGGGGGGGRNDDGQELGCPAGQTYHPANSVYAGGCCTDGHWYVWPGDPEPGCWNTPSGSD